MHTYFNGIAGTHYFRNAVSVSAVTPDYTVVITSSATAGGVTNVYAGDTITVTVSVVDVFDKGLFGAECTLLFDTDVFEYVDDSIKATAMPVGWDENFANLTKVATGEIKLGPMSLKFEPEFVAKEDNALQFTMQFKVKSIKKACAFTLTNFGGADGTSNLDPVVGASSGLSVTADQKRPGPTAPAAPTAASKTDTSITLATVSGCEYSKDGTTWQDSATFGGLSVYTDYTFYQRVKETAKNYASASSSVATIKTNKSDVAAPAAPVVASKTNTTVTLTATAGCEYSKDGTTWQDSVEFTGLSAATEYTFYQRIKEGATTNASPRSLGTKDTTDKNPAPAAPAAPVMESRTSTSVTLVATDGYLYKCEDGAWQSSNVFTGLTMGTEYTFYQKIAETDTTYESASSAAALIETEMKTTPAAPAAPKILAYTPTSVTLQGTAGYEYSIDGATWQTSNIFRNLKIGRTYTFYQRVAETVTNYASDISEGTKLFTECDHETTYTKIVKDANCKHAGEMLVICYVCDDVLERVEVPATEHKFGEWLVTKAATVDEDGVETRTCLACGITETRTLAKLTCTHTNTTKKVVKAATCEETGTAEYVCDKCGEVVKTETVNALGHKGVWSVEKEATATEDGKKVYKCSVCNEILDEEVIPATGEKPVDPPMKEKDNSGVILGVIVAVAIAGVGIVAAVIVKSKKPDEKK